MLFSLYAGAQTHDKACDLFFNIRNVMQLQHYTPKPIDDSLSVYVFNTVVESLDENHTLFLQSEYDALAIHKYTIDDYIKNRDCSFFTDFITTYRRALERRKAMGKEIMAAPLPYTTADTIVYSKTAFPYNKNIADCKKYLRKKIIFSILEDIALQSRNKDSLTLHLPSLSTASQAKIYESYQCRLEGLLHPAEGFEKAMYSRFYNAFCNYFDPHSAYFTYNNKASFLSSVSSDNYSLGIYVSQNEKEEIIVDEVVPGGPAYKTYKIDKGDQLLKLASNDLEYTVSCTSAEAITDIVYSDTYKDVELTLRKKDGTVYSVTLTKMMLKAEDHSVYSYILGDTERVGYIKIPSFYNSFNNNYQNGCAADVAQEVIKLKKQGIKGLILDLQYNGGGAMDEAISLAGMFINYGPVAYVSDGKKYKETIYDYNRGMLYDGPLVVLINGFSASASEFFAGIMQDYNRAVLLGSNTVGKASMQTIVPLVNTDANEDFIKVTINKFYRVTGNSCQYCGIEPDVKLPELFNNYLAKESTMATAMKNDSIATAERFTKMPANLFERAIMQSKTRIASNPAVAVAERINEKIDMLYEADKAPLGLNFSDVFDDIHAMDTLAEEIEELTNTETDIMVTPLPEDTILAAKDDFYKSNNEYRVNLLKTNPGVHEGVAILQDLIKMKWR